jgi:Domain of unknown function (DUF397)
MIAQNPSAAVWKKSSRSNGQANCVEVCTGQTGSVAVRDSKNVPGPHLTVSHHAWSAFVAGIKHGEFDL